MPDWSPLTSAEVHTVMARYPQPAGDEMITWRSPRPMSAAGLIRRGGVDLFVKRHHIRVRTPAQLAVEHAFIGHLRARGIAAPAVLRAADGVTATRHGDFVYEVHELAGGLDVYRDAVSWTPYASLGHARAAGAALARLHARRRTASRCRPGTPPCSPAAARSSWRPTRWRGSNGWPGGARAGEYLDGRAWPDDLTGHVLPAIRRGRAAAGPAAPAVGPRGLASVQPDLDVGRPGRRCGRAFDFGLANRTFAVHDLATALERAAVSWLDLADPRAARAGPRQTWTRSTRSWTATSRSARSPGRSRGAARGVPRGARRVRAVGGRVLRPGGQLARERRPRLRRISPRPRGLVRHPDGAAVLGHLRRRPAATTAHRVTPPLTRASAHVSRETCAFQGRLCPFRRTVRGETWAGGSV